MEYIETVGNMTYRLNSITQKIEYLADDLTFIATDMPHVILSKFKGYDINWIVVPLDEGSDEKIPINYLDRYLEWKDDYQIFEYIGIVTKLQSDNILIGFDAERVYVIPYLDYNGYVNLYEINRNTVSFHKFLNDVFVNIIAKSKFNAIWLHQVITEHHLNCDTTQAYRDNDEDTKLTKLTLNMLKKYGLYTMQVGIND